MNQRHLVVVLLSSAACSTVPPGPPTWRKIVVDSTFRSEAIAVADVDRDGDQDLLVGDCWYEAPTWHQHAIRPLGDYGDGSAGYSTCFACFADDIDGDGYVDQIVVGFPGAPAHWYRNPGATGETWQPFLIHPSACNESPAFVDLCGDGCRRLVLGDGSALVHCAPGSDPRQPWVVHPISAPGCAAAVPFAHGLGVGDLDGDGRQDVITPHGWWQQPERAGEATQPWPAHAERVGFDSAQMFARDVDADGRADVLLSSAHGRGIGWHAHRVDAQGNPFFTVRLIADHVTQTHALACADIDRDGHDDLVTGKRWWAHGPSGDVDPAGTPWLLWIRVLPGPKPRFEVHPIDDQSGVGTCFSVTDIDGDGRLDIAVANKRGVYVFLQRAP